MPGKEGRVKYIPALVVVMKCCSHLWQEGQYRFIVLQSRAQHAPNSRLCSRLRTNYRAHALSRMILPCVDESSARVVAVAEKRGDSCVWKGLSVSWDGWEMENGEGEGFAGEAVCFYEWDCELEKERAFDWIGGLVSMAG